MNFEEIFNQILNFFKVSGWSIVIFLAVLIVGVLLIRALCYAIRRILLKGKLEKTLVGFIVTLLRFVLYVVLLFILAGILGLDLTPLATALSASLVAIGLALQSSLSNLANGVILIANKPFKEGDFVDIGSVSGVVKSIGMFITVVVTPDNKKISLTNSTVIGSPIVNYSARAYRRVDFKFAVSYDSDVELVKKVIMDTVSVHEKILADPSPVVRLHEFNDSSIDFITRVWTKTEDYWSVYWDIMEEIFKQFKLHKISIPYNQIDINVKPAVVEKGGDE